MKVLVTGATGFIGRALTAALVAGGHTVRAGTRRPDRYEGPGSPVALEVSDPQRVEEALRDCDVAYFLVHALSEGRDFRQVERQGAETFAAAASQQNVGVVYLGGLGSTKPEAQLSAHLLSRQEVGEILRHRARTVELQAGVVIGKGSAAFELLRLGVDWLPLLVLPDWVHSLTQPIALDDVIRYLVAALGFPAGCYQIGGPEILTYETMIRRFAEVTGRRRTVLTVPVLAPAITSKWLHMLTELVAPLPDFGIPGPSLRLALRLLESLPADSVVTDDKVRQLVDFPLLGYGDAVRQAERQR